MERFLNRTDLPPGPVPMGISAMDMITAVHPGETPAHAALAFGIEMYPVPLVIQVSCSNGIDLLMASGHFMDDAVDGIPAGLS